MKPNNSTGADLAARTKKYALAILQLYSRLPNSTEAQVLGKQLLRAGTSVGANYREARRAKSDADFVSKCETVLQELDEAAYWLELLQEARIVKPETIEPLLSETDQLLAIFVTIVKKVKSRAK
jgi:four helix bundle protein